MIRKCEYYIPHKKRRCNFEAKAGQPFCGNHMPNVLQPERRRVPCPWGFPHSCYESELKRHTWKCPSHIQELEIKAQAYFNLNINAGPATDAVCLNTEDDSSNSPWQSDASASVRHAHAVAMGAHKFAGLLQNIQQQHSMVCAEPEQLQPLSPPECRAYLQPDNIRPFSLKHAKQQASIVGHLKQAGLLQNAQEQTYIEFGAGKGYLSSMLADGSDAKHFVFLDNQTFRMKADRSLKKVDGMQLARLRVDIKDFQPAGAPGLENGLAPWVCIGKHLCGAATDFTLRCCASSLHAHGRSHVLQNASQPADSCSLNTPADISSGQANGHSHSCECNSPVQSHAPAAALEGMHQQFRDVSDAGASRDALAAFAGNSPPGRGDSSARPASVGSDSAASEVCDDGLRRGRRGIQGLAVATCCHHRCSWQHYAGKATFIKMGFSPEDFEVMSWMTGWALCGHETPNLEESDNQVSKSAGSKQISNDSAAQQHAVTKPTGPTNSCEEAAGQSLAAPDPGVLSSIAPDNHVNTLSRSDRMQIGQKCKRLIDFGRQQWMSAQGFKVTSVLYISPEISGENRLLLATLQSGAALPTNAGSIING